MMKRTAARELTLQIYYQLDMNEDWEKSDPSHYFGDTNTEGQKDYLLSMIDDIREHRQEVDSLIERHSEKWDIKRIPKIDMAIIRVAACEMLYRDDIPAEVSINEAVELAKKFGTDDAADYINGILGNVYKDIEK